jgi:hypothetical protein
MNTQLQRLEPGTVSSSDLPQGESNFAVRDDCRISEQEERSGRRLRNLILAANAIAWIVIIVVARAIFF